MREVLLKMCVVHRSGKYTQRNPRRTDNAVETNGLACSPPGAMSVLSVGKGFTENVHSMQKADPHE
jgi:hypothetical protein